jgi:hypothetical protein
VRDWGFHVVRCVNSLLVLAIVSNSKAAIFLLLAGISCCVACGWALHLWYRFRLNQYEQELREVYALRFEHGTTIALEMHASLAQALSRSKAVLERVGEDHPDAAATRAALQEVSVLLDGAALESDRALRSLEMIPSDAMTVSKSDSQSYVDASTHTSADG